MFLNLQAACKHVDDSGNLGKSDDFAIGDVADMHHTIKRQHVMLAQTIKLDVLNNDEFIIGDSKKASLINSSGLMR